MTQRDVKVQNRLGIHARPAVLIVQTAGTFESEITLERDGRSTDAKNIIGVMMLAVESDSSVIIRAKGRDEEKAADALAKLFEDKFYED